MAQARNYVFTVNHGLMADGVNYQDDFRLIDFEAQKFVKFAVYQLEVGDDSGLEHFQGYLECIGKKSIKQLHTIPGLERAHFEVRRGTASQAITYATKEDTRVDGPWFFGEAKEQGKRNDLENIKLLVENKTPLVDIWDAHFSSMVRYHRSIKEYKRIKTPVRNHITRIYIIIGKSGIGKSRLAREMAPEAYWKPNTKWWDDYDGQSDVVWDEFTGQYPFRDLLRILDSTPLSVESKGSTVQFVADLVIFTSNFHPKDWYHPDHVGHRWDDSPLNRRIREYGEIIHLSAVPTKYYDNPIGVSPVLNLERGQ